MHAPLVADKKFYVDNKEEWGKGRRTVLLSFAGGKQLSDNDIAVYHRMKHKTVSARRTELWRLGYVEPVGMKKIHRQKGQIWQATAKGLMAIRKLFEEQHAQLHLPFASFHGDDE